MSRFPYETTSKNGEFSKRIATFALSDPTPRITVTAMPRTPGVDLNADTCANADCGVAVGDDGVVYFLEQNVSKVGILSPKGNLSVASVEDGTAPF